MGNKKTKPAIARGSKQHTTTMLPSAPYTHRIQNFLLVWLDNSIDEIKNADSINTMSKLREVVNTVHTFTTVDECVNFINSIEEENIFMISSGTLGEIIVPVVHEMPQVGAVYIFCENKTRHELWTKNWSKVKGVFTDIKPICEALKQAAHECDQNTISMSFVATNDDVTNKNLNELDQSFMYTQVLKEILLTIDFDQQHIKDFLVYCREQFIDNNNELKNIDKFEREYDKYSPIWWYTYECFLFSMLNRALRMMETDLILNMGFFVKDLHKHIEQLHSEQYAGHAHSHNFIVYRGQGLSQKEFNKLFQTKGGLLSFNNFLFTTMNQQVSLKFARETVETSDLVGVLFVMNIDPSIPSIPFANVRSVSCHQGEKEILFSMHSVFRIVDIKRMKNSNDRLWEVKLTLTSDNDPDLHSLTEQIRKETFPHLKGWYRMSNLLIKLGQIDKAQQVYETMLSHKPDEHEEAHIYHILGVIKHGRREYTQAIIYYEKSIEINQRILPPTHPDLATSYNNIGSVYENMGDYSKALSSHEKALQIRQTALPENHPDLAESYSNIGLVYQNMDDYLKALSSHEKALQIRQKILPQNHPSLAISCSNIGSMYDIIGDHSKALSFYELALNIGEHALPENHPHLQIYKKSVEIERKKL